MNGRPGGKTVVLVLANASGWLAVWAIGFISVILKINEPTQGVLLSAAKNIGAWAAAGFVSTLLLFHLLGLLERRLRSWRLCLVSGVTCLLVAVLWRLLCDLGRYELGLATSFRVQLRSLCGSATADVLTLGMFAGLYLAIRYWQELESEREKTLRAMALAHQAQLQMLRYQLNPHFLFNALTSIRAMTAEDGAKSRQMIAALAEFLRYSIDGEAKETTIGGEMAAINNYLEIQHIRFERKLEVRTEVDPQAEAAVIPCFLIHPLVENAVKYGMHTSPMPLRVLIRIVRHGRLLRIRVENTGRLLNHEAAASSVPAGTGTGLRNIVQRLELVYPGQHTFSLYEKEGWVHAGIDLQLA